MTVVMTDADVRDVRSFEGREIILFPGPADHLFRVKQGLVRVHTMDDEGNGLTLRYVKPGGFFGEESLTGGARAYFAEAVTATDVHVLDAHRLDREQERALSLDLVHAVEGLYRGLDRLASKRLRARVAAELLELSDSAIATYDDAGVPVVHITHDDLAAAVGSVRETVTKVVGELARLGAVEAGYGKVSLKDTVRLRRIADD